MQRNSLGVSRNFARVYQPKNDLGPTYHELIKYKEITARARKDNQNLYVRKQGEIDLEEVSKVLFGFLLLPKTKTDL